MANGKKQVPKNGAKGKDSSSKEKPITLAEVEANTIRSRLDDNAKTAVKLMVNSNVRSPFLLHLPKSFCRSAKFPEKEVTDFTLEDEQGKTCTARYLPHNNGLSGGWKGFAEKHGLGMGDALVFHRVEKTVIKVYIVKARGFLTSATSSSSSDGSVTTGCRQGKTIRDCTIPKKKRTRVVAKKRAKKLKVLRSITGLCSEDISREDPERIPIIATNVVDCEPYASTNFTYSKSVVFADNVTRPKQTEGCNCVGSCTDSETCPCAQPNGSYPYLSEEDGRLTVARQVIYECGKHCGCGSDCRNKVTQGELQHQLEVFRIPHKGWGVRCLDPIPVGSYLGEYVGEIRRDEDADKETNNVYLFDIDGCEEGMRRTSAKYCIDGSRIGNFVRFVNHSCDPNLVIQSVLSEHRDIKFARIVFFAYKDIPAMEELTYDYGEEYIQKNMKCHYVCDAKGCKRPRCRSAL